jgi:hypothetical protein
VHASLKVADVNEGVRPGLTAQQSIEPRRRNKVLEQENEVLRPAAASVRTAGPPVHDDLVRPDFTAQRPDQLPLTDIPSTPPARGTVQSANAIALPRCCWRPRGTAPLTGKAGIEPVCIRERGPSPR